MRRSLRLLDSQSRHILAAAGIDAQVDRLVLDRALVGDRSAGLLFSPLCHVQPVPRTLALPCREDPSIEQQVGKIARCGGL